MKYRVVLARQPRNYLARLGRDQEARILTRLHELESDPYAPPNTKALEGRPGLRSARVGDWRIVYRPDEANGIVRVVVIAPRGEVYRLI